MHTTETCVTHSYGVKLRTESTRPPSGRYSAHRHDFIDVFYKELAEWRKETRYSSFTDDKTASPHFQKIVSLGEHVVPLIVSELRSEPSFLFLALEEITGEDPVPPAALGKPRAMVDAWLHWYQNAGVNAA